MSKAAKYQEKPCSEKDVQVLRRAIVSLPVEFTAMDAIKVVCGLQGACDCWDVLNALDHLVMSSEIVELTAGLEVRGQDRRYRQ